MEARDDNVAATEAPEVIAELHKARVARDASAARDISNLINAFLPQPLERRITSQTRIS
jgi:predicted component of type VI protein secretion system